MKHVNRMAIAAVAATLLAVGCTAAGPSSTSQQQSTAPTSSVGSSSTQPAAEQTVGVEGLNGRWQVSFKLTSVNPSSMRPAADQPSAKWDCTVNAGHMTLKSGQHTYEGTLTTVGSGWRYVATASYTDESGEVWTSDVILKGTMPQHDAFTATQSGTISSKGGGKLYDATWAAKATRLP